MSDPQQQADQVAAHLVTLRGGAPFLSPTDARRLAAWLGEGVPPSVIARGLEAVAEKRRNKRAKSRLSLGAAKTAVLHWRKGELGVPDAPPEALLPLIERLEAQGEVERWAAERLRGLRGGELMDQAQSVFTQALDRAWEATDREALAGRAEVELDALREVLTPSQLEAMRDEVCRDLLRQDHPLLSASVLWDTVAQ